MTTWKPGDVAMVAARWIRTDEHSERYAVKRAGGWSSRSSINVADWEVTTVRPLVVLDPEAAADTSRLWRLLPDDLVSIDQLEAALREFANPTPPKPAEPTGLGAVVEDADGTLWTRFTREYDYDAVWSHETSHAGNRAYSTIAAVRVLSEGVAP